MGEADEIRERIGQFQSSVAKLRAYLTDAGRTLDDDTMIIVVGLVKSLDESLTVYRDYLGSDPATMEATELLGWLTRVAERMQIDAAVLIEFPGVLTHDDLARLHTGT